MGTEQFTNAIAGREKRLAGLKDMESQELTALAQELKLEHQKLSYGEATAGNQETRQQLHKLAVENERQQKILAGYTSAQYHRTVKKTAPKKPILKNVGRAFLVGGLICLFGQVVLNYFHVVVGLDTKAAGGMASVAIILATAILTGMGVYDEIGRFGGAGSMVPISGFANSVVSAALEFKREGMVYGIGAKIFTIAGPVILYGTLSSVIIGLIFFLMM